MPKIVLFLLAAALAVAADNDWSKVQHLKTGTELRVYKTGAKQPISVKMDDVSDDALIVILKNEQVAIPKEEIERIDYRPPANGSRVTKETRTNADVPDTQPVGPRPTPGTNVPGTSSSSSVGMQSRPDFETIYRRTQAARHK